MTDMWIEGKMYLQRRILFEKVFFSKTVATLPLKIAPTFFLFFKKVPSGCMNSYSHPIFSHPRHFTQPSVLRGFSELDFNVRGKANNPTTPSLLLFLSLFLPTSLREMEEEEGVEGKEREERWVGGLHDTEVTRISTLNIRSNVKSLI